MKDYEKAAIGIGAAALGFAAYQAYKTKQAADATDATDPSKNPISTAIDLAQHTIGDFTNWMHGGFDSSTGYVKGKTEDVVDTIKAAPYTVWYGITDAKDKAFKATESGTKYVWSLGAKTAKNSKTIYNQLTNKPFTLMGAAPTYVYNSLRQIPQSADGIFNVLTSVGSKAEKTTKKIGGYTGTLWKRFGSKR